MAALRGRTPEAELLLRQLPPDRTLSWIQDVTSARVINVRPLFGGASHATHAVTLQYATGQQNEIIIRRWARPDYGITDPQYTARHEAETLKLLATVDAKAPRFIASDERGIKADVPAVLESLVPGHQPLELETTLQDFCNQLAEAISTVHSINSSAAQGVALAYQRYYPVERIPIPEWATNRQIWDRALEIAALPEPEGPRCFIHRDYHHGNTLWANSQLQGVLDWDRASWGSPAIDLARMRQNLFEVFGQQAIDIFTERYRVVSGNRVSDLAYWDVVDALDSVPDATDTRWVESGFYRILEDYLARCVTAYAKI